MLLGVGSRLVGEDEPDRAPEESMRGLLVGEPRDDDFVVCGDVGMVEFPAWVGMGRNLKPGFRLRGIGVAQPRHSTSQSVR